MNPSRLHLYVTSLHWLTVDSYQLCYTKKASESVLLSYQNNKAWLAGKSSFGMTTKKILTHVFV